MLSFTQFLRQNLKKESVQNRITHLEQRFGGVKVIVGVDRLDYIKGVPQKLHALELFLTQHPEWIGKVRIHLPRSREKADASPSQHRSY
jgi:trehalose-6-phosphate synthase